MLRFAQRCNPGVVLPVKRVAAWDPSATLQLDEVAQTHLELVRAMDGGRTGSLLSIIDETCTPPGARVLRRWLLAPLLDVAAIRRGSMRWRCSSEIRWLAPSSQRSSPQVGDLERLGVRAALGEATPKDLGALRDGLLAAPERGRCGAGKSPTRRRATRSGLSSDPPDPMAAVAAELARALVDRPPPLAREGGFFARATTRGSTRRGD